MGFSEKMYNLADGMKSGARSGFMKTLLLVLRTITGFFLGLTLGLVGLEVAQYGNLALVFVTLAVLFSFIRMSQRWTLAQVLIFDLIIALVAQLLRMYILLAP